MEEKSVLAPCSRDCVGCDLFLIGGTTTAAGAACRPFLIGHHAEKFSAKGTRDLAGRGFGLTASREMIRALALNHSATFSTESTPCADGMSQNGLLPFSRH
jgi:hypothetical protein